MPAALTRRFAPNEHRIQIRHDLYMASFGAPPTPMARSIKGDDNDGSKADPDADPASLGWADGEEKLGLISIRACRCSNARHAFSGSGLLPARKKQPSSYC